MTHPGWYDEPTEECCGHCGKRNLTRYEAQDGYRCEACRAAGMPRPCRCGGGVTSCVHGVHIRRELWTLVDGTKEEVEVAGTELVDGVRRLERCPTQREHYRARQARALARREAGDKRPVGIR